jgi:hypothetical protein
MKGIGWSILYGCYPMGIKVSIITLPMNVVSHSEFGMGEVAMCNLTY